MKLPLTNSIFQIHFNNVVHLVQFCQILPNAFMHALLTSYKKVKLVCKEQSRLT